MLSYNRRNKGITLSTHIDTVEGYYMTWLQMITKEGRIHGIGSFQQKEQQKGQQRRGNWSSTLHKRIKARHEKGKDWRNY